MLAVIKHPRKKYQVKIIAKKIPFKCNSKNFNHKNLECFIACMPYSCNYK